MTEKFDPVIDWSDTKQWEKVYKPSSDTFYLCDVINQLSDKFSKNPIILEIGSGSGYVTAYTNKLLNSKNMLPISFCTDININCCLKTLETCERNNLIVFPFRDDFFSHFNGKIDILIFNPPYVETDDKELEDALKKCSIEASWAGGEDGAVVEYQCLEFINKNRDKLSQNFMFILLLDSHNLPKKMKKWCRDNNLNMDIFSKKRCEGELLYVTVVTPLNN